MSGFCNLLTWRSKKTVVEKAKKNENNRFHRKKEQWLKVESVSKIQKKNPFGA